MECLQPPCCACGCVFVRCGCGGPGRDRYLEWVRAGPVPGDFAEELCDSLGREVANGDDAVVAGGST